MRPIAFVIPGPATHILIWLTGGWPAWSVEYPPEHVGGALRVALG